MSHAIQLGDIVVFTKNFIDRHSHYPNEMSVARGKVNALHTIGKGVIVADVEWDKPGVPKRVDVKHLFCVGGSGSPP